MMRSYTFYLENGRQFYVRFYYGNNTCEIGTCETKDESAVPAGGAFYEMIKRKLQELGGYHAFKDDEQFFVKVNRIIDRVSKSVSAAYLYSNISVSARNSSVPPERKVWK